MYDSTSTLRESRWFFCETLQQTKQIQMLSKLHTWAIRQYGSILFDFPKIDNPVVLVGVAWPFVDKDLPSGAIPRWPLISTGSSINIKGAKTILSKKYFKRGTISINKHTRYVNLPHIKNFRWDTNEFCVFYIVRFRHFPLIRSVKCICVQHNQTECKYVRMIFGRTILRVYHKYTF